MDPLSVTASLLTLIGAAKAGIVGVRKLSNYRNAPRQLADLLSEIESFEEILTDIKVFSDLYPNATFSEGLIECVRFSALKIAAINDLVASDPFKLAKLSDKNHARAVWVRYKQTLLSLRDDLQVLRMDLGVRIGLVKAYGIPDRLRHIIGSKKLRRATADALLQGIVMPSRRNFERLNTSTKGDFWPAFFHNRNDEPKTKLSRQTYRDNNCSGNWKWEYRSSHNLRLNEFLLEQGVDIDHPNDIGITPSDLLSGYSFGGKVGSEGTGVVERMLRNSSNVQIRGFSTLHKIILGVVDRDLESELEISTAGINIGDARNLTPLCWATIRNDLQAVRILLAFHADPNVVDRWGHTPLDFARSIDICKMLLDAHVKTQASCTDRGRSALHQLFKRNSGRYLKSDTVGIIDLLINAKIDVNVRDDDGETPLHNAVFAGYTSHARRLLELGADPNAFSKSSRESAIHLAVSFDRYEMIPLLLGYDADYAALNANGKNIAHMAAWAASTKTVSVLAESNLVNLDMRLRCKDGKTPADYLSERSILTESEEGLHAEFEKFVKSILVPDVKEADRVSKAGTVHDSVEECYDLHLPGAYPVSAGP